MTEVACPREAGAVALRRWPPWRILNQHFADGEVADADDGYHHYGPEIAVSASYSDAPRRTRDGRESDPQVLDAFLGAEPGPGAHRDQLRDRRRADRCVRRDHARPGPRGCQHGRRVCRRGRSRLWTGGR